MSSNKKVVYKYCIVPGCKNTSLSAPEKLFISLPTDIKLRKQWQVAMRREILVSEKGSRYCCQDHFDVENDVENYMYLKIMGEGKIKVKPGIVPHIFDCHENRTNTHNKEPRELVQKLKQREILQAIQEADCQIKEPLSFQQTEETLSKKCENKGVQINLKKRVRSKSTQCLLGVNEKCTVSVKRKTSTLDEQETLIRPKKIRVIPSADEETLSSSSSFSVSYSGSTSDFSSFSDTIDLPSKNQQITHLVEKSLYVIERNPKLYLGISADSLFIVEMLADKCAMPKVHIYIALKKIKLDLSYRILADDFGMSTAMICHIIQNAIPKMAAYLRPFVQWKSMSEIAKHLPIPFRHRYKKVQCIIDCFEVSIQKPSNPILQSLSWSQYKGCNTIKYLISCSPDGLISFISNGFGGRSSDINIVMESKLLEHLESGSQVMADRGFKFLENELALINCQLVRPPSVAARQKSSKKEVKETKRIASLRIHVERVISRIREYAILQPHAQVHSALIKYLDFIVQIVCGLINIQSYLIK